MIRVIMLCSGIVLAADPGMTLYPGDDGLPLLIVPDNGSPTYFNWPGIEDCAKGPPSNMSLQSICRALLDARDCRKPTS